MLSGSTSNVIHETGKERKEESMYGTIVFFNAGRGYGFIRQVERSADVFFHVSEFLGDPKSLVRGARAEFSLGEVKGKPVARDVRLLEPGAGDE
jgi:cold shock CspA family protein